MKYNFTYNLDIEVKRIKYTVEKIEFFKENNYQIFLPRNFDIHNKDTEYIENIVSNEYNNSDYENIETILNTNINNNVDIIEKAFNITDFVLEKEYNVILTKYGVGGSYNPPNTIILNFNARNTEKELLKTVLHETIHLCINNLIIKYNIIHWEKELIVYSLFEKILPEFNIPQYIKLDNKRIQNIENIINLNFPNTENIIKEVLKTHS